MGYVTDFRGELTIEPPLTWAEIQDSGFREDQAKTNGMDVKIRVEEVEVDREEGVMIRRSGVALIPTWTDEMRGYDIVEHVQLFIDTYSPAHTLSGRFDCEGEDAGDLWRLEVHDGRAVKVKPRIVWPDGTEQATR